jgi:hypothetical protein
VVEGWTEGFSHGMRRQTGSYVVRDVWLSSGMGWGGRLKLVGNHSVFISPFRCMRSRSRRAQTACLPSRGPQLQALACTLADASRLEHTAQFGTTEPCPFTDCGLVNLGWALAQGSQRASERWARQGSACTGESDAVLMGL